MLEVGWREFLGVRMGGLVSGGGGGGIGAGRLAVGWSAGGSAPTAATASSSSSSQHVAGAGAGPGAGAGAAGPPPPTAAHEVFPEEALTLLFLRNLGPEWRRWSQTLCATNNVAGFGTGPRMGFREVVRKAEEEVERRGRGGSGAGDGDGG